MDIALRSLEIICYALAGALAHAAYRRYRRQFKAKPQHVAAESPETRARNRTGGHAGLEPYPDDSEAFEAAYGADPDARCPIYMNCSVRGPHDSHTAEFVPRLVPPVEDTDAEDDKLDAELDPSWRIFEPCRCRRLEGDNPTCPSHGAGGVAAFWYRVRRFVEWGFVDPAHPEPLKLDVGELALIITRLKGRIKRLEDRARSLELRVDRLDQRPSAPAPAPDVDRIDDDLENLGGRLQQLEARVGMEYDQRIAALEELPGGLPECIECGEPYQAHYAKTTAGFEWGACPYEPPSKYRRGKP